MAQALELAQRGEGAVEPNPMVGCLIVRDGHVVGEGWHQKYGGPHAEVVALQAAGTNAQGATAYVTLEPCCHQGKTPPCTLALKQAGLQRIVIAHSDPFPKVSGRGIAELEQAGLDVCCGVLADQARELLSPYLMRVGQRRPWVLAKWAMTLDGKIATSTGESQWISCEASREVVHQLRGRMDAILVGRGTAERDDPRLTARPAGPRLATRIVLDSEAQLSPQSRLVQSARDVPVLVAVAAAADASRCAELSRLGCEVWQTPDQTQQPQLRPLLGELADRGFTNLLVEGGAAVLGSFLDAGLVDEVHVFLAPLLLGGASAPTAVAGAGISKLAQATEVTRWHSQQIGSDHYLHGRVARAEPDGT